MLFRLITFKHSTRLWRNKFAQRVMPTDSVAVFSKTNIIKGSRLPSSQKLPLLAMCQGELTLALERLKDFDSCST